MDQEEAAEKAKERIIEIQSKLFDRAAAYSKLIVLGGYAGAFTVWANTKSQLTLRANVFIATFLGLSLAVFIFFEVYKMFSNAMYFRRTSEMLAKATSPMDFLSKWKAAEDNNARDRLIHYKAWMICLFICIADALAALGILFYNFFALLIGWPLWPG